VEDEVPRDREKACVSAALSAAGSDNIFLSSSPWMIASIEWTLVVQDHVEQATVHRQPMAVVIDEAKLLELIHEITDP